MNQYKRSSIYRSIIDKIYEEKLNHKIDAFIKFNDKKKYKMYGGVTDGMVKERLNQHIHDYDTDKTKEPITTKWKSYNPHSIKIHIDDISKEKQYRDFITTLENKLINRLGKHYKKLCVNKKNKNGEFKQTGGTGLQLDKGDIIKFYIIYGP